jgi:hypothetical protein
MQAKPEGHFDVTGIADGQADGQCTVKEAVADLRAITERAWPFRVQAERGAGR